MKRPSSSSHLPDGAAEANKVAKEAAQGRGVVERAEVPVLFLGAVLGAESGGAGG